MTPPGLESPRRHAIAAVPILGFLITPFLPFVNGPHLWLGEVIRRRFPGRDGAAARTVVPALG